MSQAADPSACGRAAFDSMAQLGIIPTPDNFAIWYEYHSGLNPELTHLIDLLMAKPRRFDADVSAAIHRKFFAHGAERDALQQINDRMQTLLQEVGAKIGDAGADASHFGTVFRDSSNALAAGATSLPDLIKRLRAEAQEMASRTAMLGLHLASATERIQALERSLRDVRRDAAIDGLTGLANRRAFDIALREAAGQAMNSGAPLCLVMIDIDHFKRFNDTWGHPVGDQVLRLVASTLSAQVRPDDRVARYGGEEFAIILPHTTAAAAVPVAERVRYAFEGKRLVARTSGKTIEGVTVSLGVACYEPGEGLAEWLERADRALYAAKHAGRNRVVVAPPPAVHEPGRPQELPPDATPPPASMSTAAA